MKIFEYPITLDEIVWRSNPRAPIREVTAADVAGADWSFVAGATGPRVEVSGHSADGVRLTNLTGVRDGEIWKRCPKCDLRKAIGEFGVEGRMDGMRDQSYCTKCRGT